MRSVLVLLNLAAAVLSGQETSPREAAAAAMNARHWLMTREKEAALGAELAREPRQTTNPLDSAVLSDFVGRIGRSLAAQLPGANIPYAFRVIADRVGGPTHEPLSVPGGYIFVPAGLILAADNEAEYAGMVAHALAHVAQRHGITIAARSLFMGITPDSPLMLVGGWTEMDAIFESQADALAVKMMSAAGYDPLALVKYIRRMQYWSEPRPARFGALPRRIVLVQRAIQRLPSKPYSSADGLPPIQSEMRRLIENFF